MHPTDAFLLLCAVPIALAAVALAVYEWRAIVDRVDGNTYSERTQVWFKTRTRKGALTFLACLVLVGLAGLAFLVWYAAHIISNFFI